MDGVVRWLRRLVICAGLIASGLVAWPYVPQVLKTPFYYAQLSAMDPPTSLAMPVQGVAAGRVADTWGAPRGKDRRHEGLDIFAPRWTTVLSRTEGVVTRVGTNRLGGLVVWVVGPGGHRHYYAHLDRQANLSVGQRVAVGTPLGTVGNTGNARGTPPHLHYGVYGDDGAFNPWPLLQAHERAAVD